MVDQAVKVIQEHNQGGGMAHTRNRRLDKTDGIVQFLKEIATLFEHRPNSDHVYFPFSCVVDVYKLYCSDAAIAKSGPASYSFFCKVLSINIIKPANPLGIAISRRLIMSARSQTHTLFRRVVIYYTIGLDAPIIEWIVLHLTVCWIYAANVYMRRSGVPIVLHTRCVSIPVSPNVTHASN